MFNRLGNHKIGILGTSGSGKTIFLTSLLWHLEQWRERDFPLGQKDGKPISINDFEEIHTKRDFNFKAKKNNFLIKKNWPEPTSDFSIAHCKFNRSDCQFTRSIKFVDIPGERVADVDMWLQKSYEKWSDDILELWQEARECIPKELRDYLGAVESPKNKLEDLILLYKKAMRSVNRDSYCAVTPSTFALTEDGKHNSVSAMTDNDLTTTELWNGGNFIPLTKNIWEKTPEYKKCKQNFEKYKSKVLKPLYAEINDCDNFIICIDILSILCRGFSAYRQETNLVSDFIKKIKPNKISELFNKISHNKTRVAFVATKADLVSGNNLDNMKNLLDDFTQSYKNTEKLNTEKFVCSAMVSTTLSPNNPDIPLANIVDPQGVILQNQPTVSGNLPNEWPEANNWQPGQFYFEEVIPKIPVGKPPKQNDLNKVFNFIIEDLL